MKTLSWILLAVLGALLLLGSVGSAYVAHRGDPRDDVLGPSRRTVADVAAWEPEVATAIRARRGTAAAFAAAYAVLLLFVVVVPYRRGDVWSWWAVLAGSLVIALLVLLRVPMLGTRLGIGTGLIQLAVVLVALLLDVRRLRAPATAG